MGKIVFQSKVLENFPKLGKDPKLRSSKDPNSNEHKKGHVKLSVKQTVIWKKS